MSFLDLLQEHRALAAQKAAQKAAEISCPSQETERREHEDLFPDLTRDRLALRRDFLFEAMQTINSITDAEEKIIVFSHCFDSLIEKIERYSLDPFSDFCALQKFYAQLQADARSFEIQLLNRIEALGEDKQTFQNNALWVNYDIAVKEWSHFEAIQKRI